MYSKIETAINQELITFAEQKLVLENESPEARKLKKEIEKLTKGLNRLWGHAIEEVVPHGSYINNTLLARKYDPISDIDLLIVISSKYRSEHCRNSPMFFRKRLMDCLIRLYPKQIIREDFPSIRLELNFIIFDIVPAFFEYDSNSHKKEYSIPNHNLKWEKISIGTLNNKNKELSSLHVNLIRLCKHWNAASIYPLKSFYLENTISNLFLPDSISIFRAFINTLHEINMKEKILILSKSENVNWTMGDDFYNALIEIYNSYEFANLAHKINKSIETPILSKKVHIHWTVGDSFYDAFVEIHNIIGIDDNAIVVMSDQSKNLHDITKLKKIRSITNTETIAILETIIKFYKSETAKQVMSLSDSHQFAILSQLLLPGLQSDWKGFPIISKYWKCRNVEGMNSDPTIYPDSYQVKRYYDSEGEITDNLGI